MTEGTLDPKVRAQLEEAEDWRATCPTCGEVWTKATLEEIRKHQCPSD